MLDYIKEKEASLLPYSYCSSGVLVSFFIFTISYRYRLPSEACLTNISILNTLNLSISYSSVKTGKANLDVNLYHPNSASVLCLILKFSCHLLFDAILSKLGISVVALALAFAFVPLSLLVSSEPLISFGKSTPIWKV